MGQSLRGSYTSSVCTCKTCVNQASHNIYACSKPGARLSALCLMGADLAISSSLLLVSPKIASCLEPCGTKAGLNACRRRDGCWEEDVLIETHNTHSTPNACQLRIIRERTPSITSTASHSI